MSGAGGSSGRGGGGSRAEIRRRRSPDSHAQARESMSGTPPGAPPVVRPDASALLHALESHVASLKAENERLAAQLAAAETRAEKQAAELAEERARTEKAIAALAALDDRLTRTEKAIAASSALAERLDALAAERAKPLGGAARSSRVSTAPSPHHVRARRVDNGQRHRAAAPQGAVGGPLIYINARAIRCAMVAFPEWKPT